MSYQDHMHKAEQQVDRIRCGVLTISDTRSEQDDASGTLIKELLAEAGYQLVSYAISADDRTQIVQVVERWTASCDVVITNGGTGIASRDVTIEALTPLFHKELPGFGELLRVLSLQEIGSGAMLSRAVSGTIDSTMIFCLPGSPAAVRLAMTQLIVPQLEHLVWLLRQK